MSLSCGWRSRYSKSINRTVPMIRVSHILQPAISSFLLLSKSRVLLSGHLGGGTCHHPRLTKLQRL